MITHKGVSQLLLTAFMMIFALSCFGCLVAAVPYVINATQGPSTGTATVLINRAAATVSGDTVKSHKTAKLHPDRQAG